MEEYVIRIVHEKIGQLGVDKCFIQIKFNYWFPKMKDKIKQYIRNCTMYILLITIRKT